MSRRIVVTAERDGNYEQRGSVSPELAENYQREEAITGPQTEARIAEYRAVMARADAARSRASRDRLTAEATAIRNDIVRGNLQMIHWAMRPIQDRDTPGWRDDAYQEATLVLIRAVETYDPSLGYRWSTYIANCLQRSLWGFFSGHGQRKIRALPAMTQWTLEDADEGPRPADDEGRVEPMDRERVRRAMMCLSARDRRILVLRFGFTEEGVVPLHMIGRRFGITKERVRQIQNRALRILETVL